MMSKEQTQALRALSSAYLKLAEVWTDELDELLSGEMLLPYRDLQEAGMEILHIADGTETA